MTKTERLDAHAKTLTDMLTDYYEQNIRVSDLERSVEHLTKEITELRRLEYDQIKSRGPFRFLPEFLR